MVADTGVEIDARVSAILQLVDQLVAGKWSARALGSGRGDALDRIIGQLHRLAEGVATTSSAQANIDVVIDSMLDALVVADEYGTIQAVNQAAMELFGYTREQLILQPLDLLFGDPEATALVLDTVTEALDASRLETICQSKTGRHFPVACSVSSMRFLNSDTGGLVCTIRDISAQQQAEQALRHSQEELIRAQSALLAELSTPLIPINDQVVVMPLIGSVDTRRAQQVIEVLLGGISNAGASVAILDITGVPVVDTQVANVLLRAAQTVKLLGARVMLTGIRPEVAQTMIGLGVDMREIVTCSSLQSGIALAMRGGYTSGKGGRLRTIA